MSDRITCPICRKFEGVRPASSEKPDSTGTKCPRCGEFWVSGTAASILENGKYAAERHILSAIVREYSDRGIPVLIRSADIDRLIKQATVPEDPLALADRLLDFMAKRAGRFAGVAHVVGKRDYPVVFGRSADDLQYLLHYLRDESLIESVPEARGYRITPYGWRHIHHTRTGSQPDQAFVAMWFDPSMEEPWEGGFKPGIEGAGYRAVRIDKVHHNEKICDKILAEIRRSGLVVADFTGQRPGVYFEAGFALGIGRAVVWTCRATDVDALHFDTRQFNHILWNSPDDLRDQLTERITALVPADVA